MLVLVFPGIFFLFILNCGAPVSGGREEFLIRLFGVAQTFTGEGGVCL